jgi:hypothetical protein
MGIDRFSGRLGVRGKLDGGAATRFMAKPIFEYAETESKLPRGAVFGMSSTGTNPDLLLLIEARTDDKGGLRWEYAHVRMTSASLIVWLDGAEVWSEGGTASNNAALGNWIYFLSQSQL